MTRTISNPWLLAAALLLSPGCNGDPDEMTDPQETSDTGPGPAPEETGEAPTPLASSSFMNITALTFGPDGTLYVGDSGDGTLSALTPPDVTNPDADTFYNLQNVDAGIAEVLGTTPASIRVKDLAVHPTTREAYLAVNRVTGDEIVSAIVVVNQAGDVRLIDPELERDAMVAIPFAPTDEFFFYRDFPSRDLSLTDLEVYEDRLIVAGMSNADFASTLWTIPLPFT
ncbi:MAG: hypothetical protein AAF211_28770, partial [Myxococcota bacterium]